MNPMQDEALEAIREYQRLASDRGTFESHWNEIAQRVLPMHSNTFSSGSQYNNPGAKKNDLIFDSTAAIALGRFAAILDSMLTPQNQTWGRLVASNPYLQKNRRVQLWFEEATRVLFKYRYAPRANFASQNNQDFKSLGAYGTSSMYIDDLETEPGLRYRNIHLGEVYLAENHQGIVDKAYRYFPLTARQAFQKWGNKRGANLPAQIRERLAQNPEQVFYFLHRVKPREDIQYGKLDARGMPFQSLYVSIETKEVIEEGGYTTFPYSVSRYEQGPGETYGRSPAMDVLPAVKTLNEEKKTILKQGHRTVDPVLLAHDDGILDSFSLKPGAVNYGGVTADGRPLVHALPVGNIALGKELMDDEREVIKDSFMTTLFQILIETPQKTATEVMELAREKSILIGPPLGRIQSEKLGSLIEREVDLLVRQRLLPPMPQELVEAKGEYTIKYDSPLTRQQQSEEAAGLMRTIETALTVVNVTQNPEPLDHFNWDVIIPEISYIQGTPARWMNDPKVIDAIRAQRSQTSQNQQMIQAAPGAAAMLKAVSAVQKGK